MTVERARSSAPALRAVRREPLILDDRIVAERLLERTSLSAESARWARVWALCWFATLTTDERFGRDEPWQIAVRLDLAATPKGAGDGARRREVLAAVEAAGIATIRSETSGRTTMLVAQLAPEMFTEHAAALSVDWGAVVAACGAEPAALLVMRALADLVVPLDATAAVPRRDLMARTGYQQKQVRVALRRLVAADLIIADGDVGTTARYRLTPRALGRRWPATEATASEAGREATGRSAPRSASIEAPPPAPVAATNPGSGADGVRVVIGGATVTVAAGASFEIGAGMSARLEVGPDGRPSLVIAPPQA